MFPLQFGKGVGQEVHDWCFAGTDADTARQFRLVVADFGFRLLDEGHDFLGPLAQADAFFREQCTAVGPDEKLLAQFLFQIGHLPGQRRLCDMQHIGCTGHILFPGDGQEVLQGPYFHGFPPGGMDFL